MRAITEQQKQEAIAAFAYEGTLIADTVYGSGHINDTFRLTFAVGNMGDLDVILQRMNADAFPHPEQLMENIAGVTGFLKKKIIARGGDPERETLNIIPTVDNKPYYRDTNGDYWRSYRFITGASSFDQVETPQQFYESAVAFGSFQRLLADYPAETLHETIPGFHDTRARFAAFEKAVREDVVGRAAEVQKEIAFFLERKETACYFAGRLDRGELPIRVTHNDTKLNNVMLDDKTGKGVCVIDVFNAVFVHGNVLGDAMFYGSGAGKLPTASAVVADVVDEAKHLHRNIMTNWSSYALKLMDMDEVEGRFFVRVSDTTMDEVEKAFGDVQTIEPDDLPDEFGFITPVMKQAEYYEKISKLTGKVLAMIRVKD